MKQTLLEMVQKIEESIQGQEINSISDTREALQIANIIKDSYYYLLRVRQIEPKNNLFSFHSLSDLTKPVYLKILDVVTEFDMFKYFDKKDERYIDLQYVEPQEFIERSLTLNPKEDNVERIQDFSGIYFNIKNDKHPQYYTIFDDEHIVLDSYDKSVEDTIQESNVIAVGVKLPPFELEDTFIPDLAPQHFGLLFSKAKVKATYELDSTINQIEQDDMRKQLITADRYSRRVRSPVSTLWKNRERTGRHI